MNEAFLKAVPLLTKIENSGYEAYFVGGSVRDYFLNNHISDVDIATSATPEELKKIFSNTVDVGIEHGTIIVLFNGEPYEITTFRTEGEYKDYRRPDEVTFVRSLEEDLSRRDFTINAMAMNKAGRIIDPLNGQKSLHDQLITTVGKPEERFSEDALRMMRALRFNSQLGFQIEQETFNALIKNGHLLAKIAIERKTVEFEKMLKGGYVAEAVNNLIKANLYKYLPGLNNKEEELAVFSKFVTPALKLEETWTLMLYCLNIKHDSIDQFLRGWRLPIKRIKSIIKLHQWFIYRLTNEWSSYDLFLAKSEYVISAEKLKQVLEQRNDPRAFTLLEERLGNMPISEQNEIVVSGKELIQWAGKPGGPWVKETLSQIERAIIEGCLQNNKERIREWFEAHAIGNKEKSN